MSGDNMRKRRRFWTEQMEAAYRFMMDIREYPVREIGEPLIALPRAAREAGIQVRFATTKIAGGFARVFALRKGLIPAFLCAAEAMNRRGWVLKVEDGYRSTAMQKELARKRGVFDSVLARLLWECGEQPATEFVFRRLTVLVATIPKIGTHMSGTAMDISVLNAADGSEIDRGAPYLEISELTPMASPFASTRGRRNREVISELLDECGFVAYPFEFWHYSAGDAYAEYLNKTGRPARYGAVHRRPGGRRVKAVPDPAKPLFTLDELKGEIRAAWNRMGKGS